MPAASLALEAVKLATTVAPYLENYLNFQDADGISASVVQLEKRVSLPGFPFGEGNPEFERLWTQRSRGGGGYFLRRRQRLGSPVFLAAFRSIRLRCASFYSKNDPTALPIGQLNNLMFLVVMEVGESKREPIVLYCLCW